VFATVKARLIALALVSVSAIAALSFGATSLLMERVAPLELAERGALAQAPLRDGILAVGRLTIASTARLDPSARAALIARGESGARSAIMGVDALLGAPDTPKEVVERLRAARASLAEIVEDPNVDFDFVEETTRRLVEAFAEVEVRYALLRYTGLPGTFAAAVGIVELPRLMETLSNGVALSFAAPTPLVQVRFNRIEGRLSQEIERVRVEVERDLGSEDGGRIRAALEKRYLAFVDRVNTSFQAPVETIDAIEDLWRGVDEVVRFTYGERRAFVWNDLYLTAGGVTATTLFILVVMVLGLRDLSLSVSGLSAAMRRMAEGDYTTEVPLTDGRDEFGAMARMLSLFRDGLRRRADLEAAERETTERLRAAARRIVEAVDAIRSASVEIAQGSEDLSARTEAGATRLEEMISAMEEIGATVAHNAENASRAREMADGARAVAGRGGACMGEMVQAMGGIESSASRIDEIVRMMEEISFQTKLLALNAAVEAARAGDAGRGFAVVAQEVRSLAERSRQASQRIRVIVGESREQVRRGVDAAETAGRALDEIVEAVRRVSDLMPEIAAASREQAQAIAEVNRSLQDFDGNGQKNAALVEESSAASRSLAEQALSLAESMAPFRVDAGDGSPPAAGRAASEVPARAPAKAPVSAAASRPRPPTGIPARARPRVEDDESAHLRHARSDDRDWTEF